jgi:hypothetical protein
MVWNVIQPEPTEQLAWLLGENARRYPIDDGDLAYPPERKLPTSIEEMIGDARTRDPDAPLPEALRNTVINRITALKAMREMCDEPYTREADEQKRTAALLPDSTMMTEPVGSIPRLPT